MAKEYSYLKDIHIPEEPPALCLQGLHEYEFESETKKGNKIFWHYKCIREGCIRGMAIDVTDALRKTGRLRDEGERFQRGENQEDRIMKLVEKDEELI